MEQQKPSLIIVAGPNGSGKTTITYKILKHEWVTNCLYINPNDIANEKFGGWNNNDAVLQSAKYCTALRLDCLENEKSLIFITVFSSPEKINFIRSAKQKGFFIRLFFVGTNNPIINASIVALRFLKGGHEVPINKIISRYSKSIENCAEISSIVDRLYVYDNSIEDMEAKLLFKASNGKLTKQYNKVNNWAMQIFKNVV